MTTLKNINKRKELAQQVYDNYSPMTEEKRKELYHEVGASFRGYETALQDITQLIVDGKDIEEIKTFIVEQINGKATKNLFRISEVPTTNMQKYINTTVKNELIHKGKNIKDATAICRSFIEYPALREGIIEREELDSIRICKHCGAPMYEGYLVNDLDTYCSEACARASISEIGWTVQEFYENLAYAEDENSCIYWTQWEG
jgi:hypothetical protein